MNSLQKDKVMYSEMMLGKRTADVLNPKIDFKLVIKRKSKSVL